MGRKLGRIFAISARNPTAPEITVADHAVVSNASGGTGSPGNDCQYSMSDQRRFVLRPMTAVAVIAAALCVVIAVVYMTTAAGKLPVFFPGHQAHSVHKHVKHGLAFLLLAAVAVVAAWFTTAPDRSEDTPATD